MKIVRNILSEPLFAELRRFSRATKVMRSNLTDWDPVVVGTSAVILVIDLDADLTGTVKAELVPHAGLADARWDMTIHLGSRLSLIPWHNDGRNYQAAITVYLNDSWQPDHAGWFIYESDDGLRAVMPERNLGLIYQTPLMHTVAMANVLAPLRESLQVFIWRQECQQA